MVFRRGPWADADPVPLKEAVEVALGSLRLAWEADRRALVAVVGLQAVSAAADVAQLALSGRAVDAAIAGRGRGAQARRLLAVGGLSLVAAGGRSASGALQRPLGRAVYRAAEGRVLDVVAAMELADVEDPALQDRLQQALMASHNEQNLVGGALAFPPAIVGLAGSLATMTASDRALVPLALVGVVPQWLVNRRTRDPMRAMWRRGREGRETAILRHYLTGSSAAHELKAFDATPYLRTRHDRLAAEAAAEEDAILRANARWSVFGALVSRAAEGPAAGRLALRVTRKEASVADAVTGGLATRRTAGGVQRLVDMTADLRRMAALVTDARSFAGPPARPATGPAPATSFTRIVVDGVRFTYRGSDRPVLDGVDLEIGQGEVVALVGENGCGKTTLAKILCGLYRPTAGAIRWDGVDATMSDPAAVRASIAVVFQDFVRFVAHRGPEHRHRPARPHGRPAGGGGGRPPGRCPRDRRRPPPGIRDRALEAVRRRGPVHRAVAAGRPGPGLPARRPAGRARRADRGPRPPGRAGPVRDGGRPVPQPLGRAHLPPAVERALRRPHLRAGRGPDHRVRCPRRPGRRRWDLRRAVRAPGPRLPLTHRRRRWRTIEGMGRRRAQHRRGLRAGFTALAACLLAGTAVPAAGQEASSTTVPPESSTTVPQPETRIIVIDTTTTTTTAPPAATTTTRPPATAPPTIRVDTSATRAAVEAGAAERQRLGEEIAVVEARVAAQEAALTEVQDRLAGEQSVLAVLQIQASAAAADLAQAGGRVARLEVSATAAAEAAARQSTPVARPPARGHSPAEAAAQARRDLEAERERQRRLQGVVAVLQQQLDAARQGTGGTGSELAAKVEELRLGREALARLREQLARAEQAPGAPVAALVPAPSALATSSIPAPYLALYGRAASTCTGMSWKVLAAVGAVESAHGQSTAPGVHQGENVAGAMGPMQFLAPTWAAYGVDATGDGVRDVYNPADAVFGAANYLCATGAGRPAALRGALWAYNHADWYVDMVLELAGRY